MSTYTVEQYLLDRALIDDTINKFWQTFDLHLGEQETIDKLADEVFATEIRVNYQILLGSEPYTIAGREQAERWAKLQASLDGSVHLMGPTVPELPIPDGQIQRPDTAVARKTVMVALRKGDKLGQNGGIGQMTLVRGDAKGNPWRLSEIWYRTMGYNIGHNVFED